jgi:hypothetical protein
MNMKMNKDMDIDMDINTDTDTNTDTEMDMEIQRLGYEDIGIGKKFNPICGIMSALCSPSGGSNIRLSPISIIMDIGLCDHQRR